MWGSAGVVATLRKASRAIQTETAELKMLEDQQKPEKMEYFEEKDLLLNRVSFPGADRNTNCSSS